MIDQLRIKDRLSEIRKRIASLKEILRVTDEESFVEDKGFAGSAAERNLEVVIQSCLDIASHIVAQMAFEKPKENKELFTILAKHEIISGNLAQNLILMTGMRNILIHEYLEVDREIIYEALQEDLTDIIEYAKEIELFLEKQKEH